MVPTDPADMPWPALFWAGSFVLLLYLVIWAICLIHCLRKRRFYPVFGHGNGTKVFWLLTFLCFNPLLILWYFFFGVLAPADREKSLARTAVVVLPSLCFAGLWLVPFFLPGPGTDPVITARDPATGEMPMPSETNFHMSAGVNEFQSGLDTTNSHSGSPDNRVAMSAVQIRVEGANPVLQHAARELHRQLAALPSIETVHRVTLGNEATPVGTRQPEVYVTLRLDVSEDAPWRPLHRQGRLIVTAGSEPVVAASQYYDTYTPPRITWTWRSTVSFEDAFRGVYTPGTPDKLTGERLGTTVFEALHKYLQEIREEEGMMPPLPDSFYGPFIEASVPEFPEAAQAELIYSVYGLMTNNASLWRFEHTGTPEVLLRSFFDTFTARGWRGEDFREEMGHVRLTDQEDVIELFPNRPHPGQGLVPEAPETAATRWNIRYLDRFGKDQIAAALQDLFDSDADPRTLLMFWREFQTFGPYKPFVARLETDAPGLLPVQLLLARDALYDRSPERARAHFDRAVALAWIDPDGHDYRSEMKRIAEDLGLDEQAVTEPGRAALVEAGLLPLADFQDPTAFEVAPDAPAGVFSEEDGVPVEALVFRVREENGMFQVLTFTRDAHSTGFGKQPLPATGGSQLAWTGNSATPQFEVHYSPLPDGKWQVIMTRSQM
jgi:hypothetical protein